MRWIARVVLLTSVAAVAAGVGFAVAGDGSHSASAHGNRSHGPFGFSKVVFLSHVNTVGMPIFPGDPPFELETLFTVENDGFKLNKMTIGEHSGTHWGAPCHFNAGERCAEDMAPEDFFHPAAIVDARRQSAKDPDYALTVADLKRFERKHGRIPRNAVVVMWTGWQERWDDPDGVLQRGRGRRHALPGHLGGGDAVADRQPASSAASGSTRTASTRAPTRRTRRTRSSSRGTASTSRTWAAWSRCPRTAAGSSSAASGTRADRARPRPSSGSCREEVKR